MEQIEQYMPLVWSISNRIAAKLCYRVLADDLAASGWIGLHDAVKRNDGNGNFEAYASMRIKGEIFDELERTRLTVGKGRGRNSPIGVMDCIDDVSGDGELPGDRLMANAECFEVWRYIDHLNARDQQIIHMIYFEGIKQRYVSRALNLSEVRISQLHTRALARLRNIIAKEKNNV